MTKIFIATPTYDGKVNAQYSIALAETMTFLAGHGIQCQIAINCGGSLLIAERNRLLMQFLATDCTHMLCVDSDLGWPCMAVKGMLDKDVDFVAGLYPTRRDNMFLFRPCINEDGSLVADKQKGILKMLYVPAGFLLLKRNLVEGLFEFYQNLFYSSKDNVMPPGYCLFDTEVKDGEFWGEDYVFCRRVRDAGFDIWVDPCIEFDHSGVKGIFTSILRDKKDETV